jgi:hypothetical protein
MTLRVIACPACLRSAHQVDLLIAFAGRPSPCCRCPEPALVVQSAAGVAPVVALAGASTGNVHIASTLKVRRSEEHGVGLSRSKMPHVCFFAGSFVPPRSTNGEN